MGPLATHSCGQMQHLHQASEARHNLALNLSRALPPSRQLATRLVLWSTSNWACDFPLLLRASGVKIPFCLPWEARLTTQPLPVFPRSRPSGRDVVLTAELLVYTVSFVFEDTPEPDPPGGHRPNTVLGLETW